MWKEAVAFTVKWTSLNLQQDFRRSFPLPCIHRTRFPRYPSLIKMWSTSFLAALSVPSHIWRVWVFKGKKTQLSLWYLSFLCSSSAVCLFAIFWLCPSSIFSFHRWLCSDAVAGCLNGGQKRKSCCPLSVCVYLSFSERLVNAYPTPSLPSRSQCQRITQSPSTHTHIKVWEMNSCMLLRMYLYC